jgi:hypothetical protein
MEKRTNLFLQNVAYRFILLGVAIWFTGHFVPDSVMLWQVKVSTLISEGGALIAAIFTVHAIFEHQLKRELMRDLFESFGRSSSVLESGIGAVHGNSTKLDYTPDIETSHRIVIGLHYSDRLFRQLTDRLQRRSQVKTMETTLLICNGKGPAFDYLLSQLDSEAFRTRARASLEILVSQARAIQNSNTRFEVLRHDKVLPYSFVVADSRLWIKPFRVSSGRHEITALEIQGGHSLVQLFF